MMSKDKERRKSPRVNAVLPIEIEEGNVHSDGVICNLSRGGVLCRSQSFIPVHTKVEVSLLIPCFESPHTKFKGYRRVQAEGVVVRSEEAPSEEEDPYKVAVFFTGMNEEDLTFINAYVARMRCGGGGPRCRKMKRGDGRLILELTKGRTKVVGDCVEVRSTGILCRTPHFVPPFREIQMEMQLPGEEAPSVSCAGVVVDCEKDPSMDRYDLALFFTEMSKTDREKIFEYLDVGRESA